MNRWHWLNGTGNATPIITSKNKMVENSIRVTSVDTLPLDFEADGEKFNWGHTNVPPEILFEKKSHQRSYTVQKHSLYSYLSELCRSDTFYVNIFPSALKERPQPTG